MHRLEGSPAARRTSANHRLEPPRGSNPAGPNRSASVTTTDRQTNHSRSTRPRPVRVDPHPGKASVEPPPNVEQQTPAVPHPASSGAQLFQRQFRLLARRDHADVQPGLVLFTRTRKGATNWPPARARLRWRIARAHSGPGRRSSRRRAQVCSGRQCPPPSRAGQSSPVRLEPPRPSRDDTTEAVKATRKTVRRRVCCHQTCGSLLVPRSRAANVAPANRPRVSPGKRGRLRPGDWTIPGLHHWQLSSPPTSPGQAS